MVNCRSVWQQNRKNLENWEQHVRRLRFQQVGCARWGVSFPAVSFAQRIGEERDEVASAACLAGRSTEMFGGSRSGELNSLAGEAARRGRPQ